MYSVDTKLSLDSASAYKAHTWFESTLVAVAAVAVAS